MRKLACNVALALWGCSVLRSAVAGTGERLDWNANAEWFMYAPSFAFKEVSGAANYRFRVLDDYHVTHEFTASRPTEALSPV